jgi:hypothetical protein
MRCQQQRLSGVTIDAHLYALHEESNGRLDTRVRSVECDPNRTRQGRVRVALKQETDKRPHVSRDV